MSPHTGSVARGTLAARRVGQVLVVIGISLRLAWLVSGRPLWLDESTLALNILSRPLGGFFRALDEWQMAPLGFLWAEWFVTRLAGASELALRAVPFAAGALALVAFARLSRRLLNTGAAIVATALAAVSPMLVHYSAEVKSYGIDALMAILLMHATLDITGSVTTQQLKPLKRWAFVAAITALVCTSAPFIVAGCAAALLAAPEVRRASGALVRLGAACVPAALVFALQLATVYHTPNTTAFMRAFWVGAFLEPRVIPAVVGLANAVRGLWGSTLVGSVVESVLPPKTLSVIVALSLVGLVALARRHRVHVIMLLAPLLLAACAALAQQWPLIPRLLLFAAPAVFVSLAAGLAAVARLAPARTQPAALAALAVVVTASSALGLAAELRDASAFEPVPLVAAEISARGEAHASIYVSAPFVAACSYYSVWHLRHVDFSGDSTVQACSVRGVRTVVGIWPEREPWLDHNSSTSALPVTTEWIASESSRILEGASGTLWVMSKAEPSITAGLRTAIERAGAVHVSERQWPGLTLHEYRLAPARRPSRPPP